MTPYQHPLGLLCGTRDHLYLSYGSDTGQCLATKSQGCQRGQVVDRADLAGRKPLQRQSGILGAHAAAVVGDLDETSPAIDQLNVNTGAASIEGIVNEFLQHRSGTLDHFPSGHQARGGWIKLLHTRSHGETSRCPTSVRVCCCRSWRSERACRGVIWQTSRPSSRCARTARACTSPGGREPFTAGRV